MISKGVSLSQITDGMCYSYRSRDGYGLDDRNVGVQVPVESRIFASPCHPGRLWGPPCLLFNGHRGVFPRG
jgi:hypothetical protein